MLWPALLASVGSTLVLQALAAPVAIESAPTATIESGVVIGVQTSVPNSSNLVNKYLGIPYASRPERFSAPQPAQPWSSPYDASQNGPACVQQFSYPEAQREFNIAAFNTPAPEESEDCLNINVFVPAGAEQGNSEPKAVLFWIYGGALAFGTNQIPAYDGSSFAANQDVILVAANYRTNVFGFPAAPGLEASQRNLGFLDQRFALQWVQSNIASFGGDPSRVTIFGESAGSWSVDFLVTAPPSNPPPFNGAIMESGQSSVSPLPPSDGSEWAMLIESLNCSSNGFESSPSGDLECARAADASTLRDIGERLALNYRGTVDNVTVLANPEAARLDGSAAQVPILTGTNANEGNLFTVGMDNTTAFLSATGFDNNTIPQILQVYPFNSIYPPGGNLIVNDTIQTSSIYTDLAFECCSAIVANDSSTNSASPVPTWRYLYNGTFPLIQPVLGLDIDFEAYHSAEIALVFGTYPFWVARANAYGATNGGLTDQVASEALMRLSEYMQGAWATFARNPAGGPGWTSANEIEGYVEVLGSRDENDQVVLSRGSSSAEIDGLRCEVWKLLYDAVASGGSS